MSDVAKPRPEGRVGARSTRTTRSPLALKYNFKEAVE
jgi:hypothetical protein